MKQSSNNFPEKPELSDSIEKEIDYTKALLELLEKEEIVSKKAKKQLEKIKKTLELPHLKELQNANDDEAKIGHKSEKDDFFGYKNHIAVTEDEQFITALVVTNGNESDTPHFEKLVEQSVERGVDFDEVLGDRNNFV